MKKNNFILIEVAFKEVKYTYMNPVKFIAENVKEENEKLVIRLKGKYTKIFLCDILFYNIEELSEDNGHYNVNIR